MNATWRQEHPTLDTTDYWILYMMEWCRQYCCTRYTRHQVAMVRSEVLRLHFSRA